MGTFHEDLCKCMVISCSIIIMSYFGQNAVEKKHIIC